jgi:hypothetical protein
MMLELNFVRPFGIIETNLRTVEPIAELLSVFLDGVPIAIHLSTSRI